MAGNGTDVGQLVAMLRDLVNGQLELREAVGMIAAELRVQGRRLDDLKVEVMLQSRRMDALERRMAALEGRMGAFEGRLGELGSDVAALRQEVRDYHGSVVGHGVLLGELEQRVIRIERHLDLPSHAA